MPRQRAELSQAQSRRFTCTHDFAVAVALFAALSSAKLREKPMHDTTDPHWHEPEGLKNAGYGAWKRPNTTYDDYMEAQGIPIYRGIGVRRVQDMPLKRWNRMGGNGTFIQLYGTEGRWGCYVVEVPGAGALTPERHMYEEIMVVV